MTFIIVFIICLLGSIVQGSTGFGYAIFTMPLLSFFIPFKVASAVVLLSTFVMTAQMSYKLRKYVRSIKAILPPVLASTVGRTIGVYALMTLNVNILQSILGVVLTLLSIYFALYKEKIKIDPSMKNGIIAGTISGILGGMFNTGGPPLVMYYLSSSSSNMEYNSSLQITFLLNSICTIFLHLLYGNLNIEVLQLTAIGMAAVFIGCSIGLFIFQRLSKELLSRIIYVFMGGMGIMLMVKGALL